MQKINFSLPRSGMFRNAIFANMEIALTLHAFKIRKGTKYFWDKNQDQNSDLSRDQKNGPKWRLTFLNSKKEVICWVARPHEKTYLVRYMLVMQLISIALTISEVSEFWFVEILITRVNLSGYKSYFQLSLFTIKWSFRLHKPAAKRNPMIRDLNKGQFSKLRFDLWLAYSIVQSAFGNQRKSTLGRVRLEKTNMSNTEIWVKNVRRSVVL